MRIILKKDIPKLGSKDDVKDVSPGFAQNFLIPKGLAEPATEAVMARLEEKKKTGAEVAEKELDKLQKLISSVEGAYIELPMKVTEKGGTYSSVSALRIAEALQKAGYDVKDNHIKLDRPIDKVGEHTVSLSFAKGLETKIKVMVIPQKNKEKASKVGGKGKASI